jgi:hypothetical protein
MRTYIVCKITLQSNDIEPFTLSHLIVFILFSIFDSLLCDRYETAFQQLKERAADKERLRQQQEKQHHASPLSSPTVVGQNVDTASVKGCTSTGSALAAAAAASASAAVSGASVTVNGTASGSSLPRSSGSAPLLAPAVVAHTASAPRKPSI